MRERKRASSPPKRKNTTTMYELIGGEETINKAVDILYEKVSADDRVSGLLVNIDMEAKTRMQRVFWTKVFQDLDGTTDVSEELRKAHAHLPLTDMHFDVIIEHLTAAFKELYIPIELSAPIMGRIIPLRSFVLDRKETDDV
jgi:hemoglobin